MKPAPFLYAAPSTLEDALAVLSEHEGDSKIIAGGQSLIPLMNMRLSEPEVVVDISRIPGLNQITDDGTHIEIGAMTTHQEVIDSALVRAKCPLLAEAGKRIAHRQVRHRGTIGGSVSHADPAGEFPTAAVTLDAEICITGPEGERRIGTEELFLGYLMTTLKPNEIVTSLRFPVAPPNTGVGVEELARKENYFAIAGSLCQLSVSSGVISDAKVGVMGCSPAPLKAREVEDLLVGEKLTRELLYEVAQVTRDLVSPDEDLHGTEEYRREMAGVMVRRALQRAWDQAQVKG